MSSTLHSHNINQMIECYNFEVERWHRKSDKTTNLDDFVLTDHTKIKWSSRLKECLLRGQKANFSVGKIRQALYRPFCLQYLYFDEILTHRRSQFPFIYPIPETENENQVICFTGISSEKSFVGSSSRLRSTNDEDWLLSEENRLLSAVEAFRAFAEAGKKLAELHVNYEQQPKYKLKFIEKEGEQLDWRVTKMKLSKDKTQLIYNNFLTLSGIPAEAFEYKLGNKSALHWVIDQYQVKPTRAAALLTTLTARTSRTISSA